MIQSPPQSILQNSNSLILTNKTVFVKPKRTAYKSPFQACHHCGKNPAKFTCKSPGCKNAYCKRCMTSIYRYSYQSLAKLIKSKRWACPACHNKCLCGKCPLPIKNINLRNDVKLSQINQLPFEKPPSVNLNLSNGRENLGPVYDINNGSASQENEKLKRTSVNMQSLCNFEKDNMDIYRRNSPEYGEIIDPNSFRFGQPNGNLSLNEAAALPYIMPMAYGASRIIYYPMIPNAGFTQYGAYQNITTMIQSPFNLQQYHGPSNGC